MGVKETLHLVRLVYGLKFLIFLSISSSPYSLEWTHSLAHLGRLIRAPDINEGAQVNVTHSPRTLLPASLCSLSLVSCLLSSTALPTCHLACCRQCICMRWIYPLPRRLLCTTPYYNATSLTLYVTCLLFLLNTSTTLSLLYIYNV